MYGIVRHRDNFNSARSPIYNPKEADGYGRLSVLLAQRQYMLENTVTVHSIRVIPRLAIFDQIRWQPVYDSRLTLIPA